MSDDQDRSPAPAGQAAQPVDQGQPDEMAPAGDSDEAVTADAGAGDLPDTAAAEDAPAAEHAVGDIAAAEDATPADAPGFAEAGTAAGEPDVAATPEAASSGVPEAAASPNRLREPDEDSLRLAEALIFASAEPVSARALTRVLPDDIDADAVLARLRERYAGRGVELIDIGTGVMFRTAPDLAPRLRKVIEVPRRLPRVALETLAIIAYHQPMTRPEIEHIRGTALSQQTLDSLLELNLIAPKGRRETPGRPTLWGTTPEFLAHFGLKDLRELPRREDLLLETAPPKPTPEVLPADLQPPPEPAKEQPA